MNKTLTPPSLADWMTEQARRVENVLEKLLSPPDDPALANLYDALRYAALDGGKRVRPLLVLATGSACGAPQNALLQAAAAIELVHAYSLVHDDLPCMDNDVLRRGKPTVHVKYGEALALLAGDALQTLAFATLSRCALPAAQVLQMVQVLAQASGANGMAGGQAIDLASVGKMAGTPLTQDGLEHMHRLKTGALLRASVQIGGICGNLNAVSLQALDVYAAALGLAFQVIDDILDVEADSITLGKTAGKDAQHAKPTYVSILGLANAKRFSQELQQQGHLALEKLPGAQSDWQRLHELLDYVVVRRH